MAAAFFERVLKQAGAAGLLQDEHFTVDGTLIDSWASLKSFRLKDGPPPPSSGGPNPKVDFRRERRSNATHAFTIDPDARLLTKSFRTNGQALLFRPCAMDNRDNLGIATPGTGRKSSAGLGGFF